MNDLKKLGLVLTAIGIAILASMRLADFLEKRIELSGHGEYPVRRAMDPFKDISYLRTLMIVDRNQWEDPLEPPSDRFADWRTGRGMAALKAAVRRSNLGLVLRHLLGIQG